MLLVAKRQLNAAKKSVSSTESSLQDGCSAKLYWSQGPACSTTKFVVSYMRG